MAGAKPAEKPEQETGKGKTVIDVYAGYAEKAKKDAPHEVSLLDKIDVEFTKDFRSYKKGQKLLGISRVAYDFYDANEVVKVLKETLGATDKELEEDETK